MSILAIVVFTITIGDIIGLTVLSLIGLTILYVWIMCSYYDWKIRKHERKAEEDERRKK